MNVSGATSGAAHGADTHVLDDSENGMTITYQWDPQRPGTRAELKMDKFARLSLKFLKRHIQSPSLSTEQAKNIEKGTPENQRQINETSKDNAEVLDVSSDVSSNSEKINAKKGNNVQAVRDLIESIAIANKLRKKRKVAKLKRNCRWDSTLGSTATCANAVTATSKETAVTNILKRRKSGTRVS